MRVSINEKIIVRIGSDILKFGDIAFVKEINHNRPFPYFCVCPLRGKGEWLPPQFFDKYKERPPIKKQIIPERIKFYAAEKRVRPKAEYGNLKSPYGIASDLHKNNNDTPHTD